jgi:hypothetical protein
MIDGWGSIVALLLVLELVSMDGQDGWTWLYPGRCALSLKLVVQMFDQSISLRSRLSPPFSPCSRIEHRVKGCASSQRLKV